MSSSLSSTSPGYLPPIPTRAQYDQDAQQQKDDDDDVSSSFSSDNDIDDQKKKKIITIKNQHVVKNQPVDLCVEVSASFGDDHQDSGVQTPPEEELNNDNNSNNRKPLPIDFVRAATATANDVAITLATDNNSTHRSINPPTLDQECVDKARMENSKDEMAAAIANNNRKTSAEKYTNTPPSPDKEDDEEEEEEDDEEQKDIVTASVAQSSTGAVAIGENANPGFVKKSISFSGAGSTTKVKNNRVDLAIELDQDELDDDDEQIPTPTEKDGNARSINPPTLDEKAVDKARIESENAEKTSAIAKNDNDENTSDDDEGADEDKEKEVQREKKAVATGENANPGFVKKSISFSGAGSTKKVKNNRVDLAIELDQDELDDDDEQIPTPDG